MPELHADSTAHTIRVVSIGVQRHRKRKRFGNMSLNLANFLMDDLNRLLVFATANLEKPQEFRY
jgi:hypothetical protein